MPRGPRRRATRALLVSLTLAALLAACAKDGGASADATSTPARATGPFALTTNPAAAIKAAGLPALASEGQVAHYHAHLDVIVDGAAVPVPANIGIDNASRTISPLHTHTPDGIVHIEAEEDADFTVGQLLTEWGVELDTTCIATYCADDTHQLLAFKNGQPAADPAAIVFKAHDEVVLWYGPKGTTPSVPSSYEFKGGL